MSKTQKITPVDFEKSVMAKVKSRQITMKPRWYFAAGSILMIAGLTALSVGAIFLTNLTLFTLRRHGPMASWRLEMMLQSFPWWIPLLAIMGIALGIWMLKKYDFSYKRNFILIVLGFIVSILIAAFIIDSLGLNDIWSKKGPMKRLYQQVETDRGYGWQRYK